MDLSSNYEKLFLAIMIASFFCMIGTRLSRPVSMKRQRAGASTYCDRPFAENSDEI